MFNTDNYQFDEQQNFFETEENFSDIDKFYYEDPYADLLEDFNDEIHLEE